MLIPKIRDVEAIPISMPFTMSLTSGKMETLDRANSIVIRVVLEDGTVGIGEAKSSYQVLGESHASVCHAIKEWISPRICGMAVSDIEAISARLSVIKGNASAKSGIDMAIHDAWARVLGIPLYRLLGGFKNKIDLTWILGQASTDHMCEDALSAHAKGFNAFKIKIGKDPKKDIEVVTRLRKALGDQAFLYVDGNQGLLYGEAVKTLVAIEDMVAMVEDPISIDDHVGRRRLADKLKIPMLGDECGTNVADVRREIDLGIVRVMNVKPMRSGFTESVKMIRMMEQASILNLTGTLLETDLGALASAHLTAALRAFAYPAELTYWLKMEGRLLENGPAAVNGSLTLPEAPGLGASLNMDIVRRYQIAL